MRNTLLKTNGVGAGAGSHAVPFQLRSELVLKSTVNPALEAKTTVYGVVPGEMIIVEEPLFSLNERFAGISGELACARMHLNQTVDDLVCTIMNVMCLLIPVHMDI